MKLSAVSSLIVWSLVFVPPVVGETVLRPRASTSIQISGEAMIVNGEWSIPAAAFGIKAENLTPDLLAKLNPGAVHSIHSEVSTNSIALNDSGNLKPLFEKLTAIDSQGTGFSPLAHLAKPDFESFFAEAARTYALRCQEANWNGTVQFWERPFFASGQADHSTYPIEIFDKEGQAPNAAARIIGWKSPLDSLRWASSSTSTGESTWKLHDPTQKEFWPGEQALKLYIKMFLPYAKAIKETTPKVNVIGGWDLALSLGDWSVWEQLAKPLIDASAETADGYTERHHSIDTRAVAAAFEIPTAYSYPRFRRGIRIYNTGWSGQHDVVAMDGYNSFPDKQLPEVGSAIAESTYALRSLIELLFFCPDKIGSAIASISSPSSGQAIALEFLRDLRGQLMHVQVSNPDVWAVAALTNGQMIVTAFNNAPESQSLHLNIGSPQGMLLESASASWLASDPQSNKIIEKTKPIPVTRNSLRTEQELAPLHAMKLMIQLSRKALVPPTIARLQHFAIEDVFHDVKPGEPATLHIQLPHRDMEGMYRARLRLIFEGIEDSQGILMINGVRLPLAQRNWMYEIPLNPVVLRSLVRLVFECPDPEDNGYRVNAASIIIERPLGKR